MAKIKIPPVLRASTAGEREVAADGDNVGAVLNALADAGAGRVDLLLAADGRPQHGWDLDRRHDSRHLSVRAAR